MKGEIIPEVVPKTQSTQVSPSGSPFRFQGFAPIAKPKFVDPMKPLCDALKLPYSQRTSNQKNVICNYLRTIQIFKRFTSKTLIQISNGLKFNQMAAEETIERTKNEYTIVMSGLFYLLT